MKKIILVSFIFFQFNQLYSQEIQTEIQGKKVDYFINVEKKLKSELFDTNQTYMSLDDSAQPIIYKRKEKNIPDLLVQYSFSKKDSLLNEVLYEWDVYNFEKDDNNVKPEKFNKALIEKYKNLLNTLTKKYGKSINDGNLDNLKDIETSKGLSQKNNWKPNDSLEIEMYTSISNYYKKEGFATTNPTHRIRLYIKNIKKKVEPKLDEKSIFISNQNFESFISKLKENNFTDAKLFLSDIVMQKVNENQLIELRKMVDFNNKLVQYFKGFQMTLTGENYLMLQYKYENEQSEIPKSIIKVIFDENNKILGIQPMKKE
jgi:hypothetical protein